MNRGELAKRVAETCWLRGQFHPRSGHTSNIYFDKYRFESDPVLLSGVAQLLPLVPAGCEVLAGIEIGGIPIATALSLISGLPVCFVRRAAKSYGTTQVADGLDIAGRRLVLIEDVVSTGGQFAEVESLIKDKQLLIVPSGALTRLPFQVLVTASPNATVPAEVAGYRDTAWLGARHAITVLPAVSSLKALRGYAKASHASEVNLGVGNPLLDGPDARFAELARKARASKSCPAAPTPVATLDAGQGGVVPIEIRGGLANVADLRTQAPLPETAEELCAVAHDLKADVSEVRLGDRATEAEIKRLSRSGELARYRVLHFATHGAMAGELDKDREPGLILTPPQTTSAEDDGYISMRQRLGPHPARPRAA